MRLVTYGPVQTVIQELFLHLGKCFRSINRDATQVTRVWLVLWHYVKAHVHAQVLLPEKLFTTCVTRKVLNADMVLDHVLLQGVLVLKGGGTLGTGEDMLRMNLIQDK